MYFVNVNLLDLLPSGRQACVRERACFLVVFFSFAASNFVSDIWEEEKRNENEV